MPYANGVVRDERGMALGLALFALVVIGGMVAGNFLAGMLEQQSGGNTLYVSQAAEAAEAELRETLLAAPMSDLASLPVGGAPLDLGTGSPSPGTVVERRVSRLTDHLFLIQTRGTRRDAGGGALATRTIGLLATWAVDSSGGGVLQPLSERPWAQLY
jgi:hypothetical protein